MSCLVAQIGKCALEGACEWQTALGHDRGIHDEEKVIEESFCVHSFLVCGHFVVKRQEVLWALLF